MNMTNPQAIFKREKELRELFQDKEEKRYRHKL